MGVPAIGGGQMLHRVLSWACVLSARLSGYRCRVSATTNSMSITMEIVIKIRPVTYNLE